MPPTLRIETDEPGLRLQLKVARASAVRRWRDRLTSLLGRRRWSAQALPYLVGLGADESGLSLTAEGTFSAHKSMQVAFEAAQLRHIIVEPLAQDGSARSRPLYMEFFIESGDEHHRLEPYACMAYVAELDQNEEVEDFCSRLGAALEFSSMRVEPERIELFRRAPCVVGSPFRSANRAGQPITTPKERADYDDPPPEQATQPSGPPPEPSEPLDAQGLKRVLREPPRGRYQLIGWDLEGAVVGKEEDAPSPPGARLGLELPLWRRLAAAGVSLLELMFCGLFLPFLGLVLGWAVGLPVSALVDLAGFNAQGVVEWFRAIGAGCFLVLNLWAFDGGATTSIVEHVRWLYAQRHTTIDFRAEVVGFYFVYGRHKHVGFDKIEGVRLETGTELAAVSLNLGSSGLTRLFEWTEGEHLPLAEQLAIRLAIALDVSLERHQKEEPEQPAPEQPAPKQPAPKRLRVATINVGALDVFDEGDEVNVKALVDRGLIDPTFNAFKVLGSGQLDKPLFVAAHAFSRSAKRHIELAGGQARLVR